MTFSKATLEMYRADGFKFLAYLSMIGELSNYAFRNLVDLTAFLAQDGFHSSFTVIEL